MGADADISAPPSVEASDLDAPPVREGEVLAGKYRVGEVLGRGGVGVVVAATHLMLQQKLALKVLSRSAPAEMRGRFLREGQSAARLKGEHVAKVLDMGKLPDGTPFLAMEFLDGSDLEVTLKREGPLPIEDAVGYVVQACEAMAEAHAAGIVHRDLKPANLFLTTAPDGTPFIKVVDFGISKDFLEGPGDHKLTRTTTVIGSPLYMPPEQMRAARETDARSDIWALGVILYELLTGQMPFMAEMYPDLVIKVATEPAPPPSAVRREIPAKLDAAILRCLAKKREQRFQDVGQLAAALAPFGPKGAGDAAERAQRLLDASPGSRALAVPAGTADVRGEVAWAQTRGSGGRQPGLAKMLGGVAAGVVVALGAAGLLLRQTGPHAEPASADTAASGTTAPASLSAEVRVTPAESVEIAPSAAPPDAMPAPSGALSGAAPQATAHPVATPARPIAAPATAPATRPTPATQTTAAPAQTAAPTATTPANPIQLRPM